MDLLQQYGSDEENNEQSEPTPKLDVTLELKKSVNLTPIVNTEEIQPHKEFHNPTTTVVYHNPKYEELFTPIQGPENPFRQKRVLNQNHLTGSFEVAGVEDFHFDEQRKTFQALGYALDPSNSGKFIGDAERASNLDGRTISNKLPSLGEKRKRLKRGDASDPLNYDGPWAGYEGENIHIKYDKEENEEGEGKKEGGEREGSPGEFGPGTEKTIFHGKVEKDYLGRSYMTPPQDIDVDLHADPSAHDCFLPKKLIHTWSGHTKGVTAIRFLPKTAHLLLSSSMDCKIKIWDVYNQRHCLRTFVGHTKMVRDICFSNDGSRFLSCGFDKYIKLWDTETGQCISRFTNKKIPYCVKFNPDDDKQNIFVAGCSDKKIIQWDTNTGNIVQEYDQHLGPVNTITFVDQNRRFVTTSDDKSLRVWEWNIPVVIKYIAEPHMHSMPAVTLHPSQKWMACQSLDNQILIYSALDKFRLHRKKVFKGHTVAGYACQVNFSPDGRYLLSGDSEGNLWFWDWKSCKVVKKMKAHDQVVIGCEWHPHETSKVATCSWDGTIKYWD